MRTLPALSGKFADYLDLEIDESNFSKIVEHCSLGYMKEAAAKFEFLNMVFEGGGSNFINKGTNGRWKDVLSMEEIAKADRVAAQNLTPDCAHWLKTGALPN